MKLVEDEDVMLEFDDVEVLLIVEGVEVPLTVEDVEMLLMIEDVVFKGVVPFVGKPPVDPLDGAPPCQKPRHVATYPRAGNSTPVTVEINSQYELLYRLNPRHCGTESQKASQAVAPLEVFHADITFPSNFMPQFKV